LDIVGDLRTAIVAEHGGLSLMDTRIPRPRFVFSLTRATHVPSGRNDTTCPPRCDRGFANSQVVYKLSGKASPALASARWSTPMACSSETDREIEISDTSMCRARSSIFFSRKESGLST